MSTGVNGGHRNGKTNGHVNGGPSNDDDVSQPLPVFGPAAGRPVTNGTDDEGSAG